MSNPCLDYCERFNEDVMTFGMPLGPEEMDAMFRKALADNKPIDWLTVIGYDPTEDIPDNIII